MAVARREEIIKLNLRLPERLHRRLEREVARKGRSLNWEIISRLQDSFNLDEIRQEARDLLQKSSFDASAIADHTRDGIKMLIEMAAERVARAQVMAQRLTDEPKDESK
jgi:hypothetical protein